VPLLLLYAALLVPRLPVLLPLLANPRLADIAHLLGTPDGATIGWIHFLALDFFVGRWAYLDSRDRGLSAWLVSPVLFVTLLAGPLGLALYLLLRVAAPGTEKPTPMAQG
jgi:hypothetical protein